MLLICNFHKFFIENHLILTPCPTGPLNQIYKISNFATGVGWGGGGGVLSKTLIGSAEHKFRTISTCLWRKTIYPQPPVISTPLGSCIMLQLEHKTRQRITPLIYLYLDTVEFHSKERSLLEHLVPERIQETRKYQCASLAYVDGEWLS